MRRQMLAAALVGTLALVGCGTQGVQLDKEVTVEGMTLSVPSSWNEEDHGGTTTFDGPADDNGRVSDAIIVSYEDTGGQTIEEYAGDTYDGAKQSGELEVDGMDCQTYDFDGTPVAIIDAGETIFDVMVLGDDVSMDSLLSTVSFD